MDFPRRARANFTSLGTEIQGHSGSQALPGQHSVNALTRTLFPLSSHDPNYPQLPSPFLLPEEPPECSDRNEFQPTRFGWRMEPPRASRMARQSSAMRPVAEAEQPVESREERKRRLSPERCRRWREIHYPHRALRKAGQKPADPVDSEPAEFFEDPAFLENDLPAWPDTVLETVSNPLFFTASAVKTK
jgi:hypothetical protein